MFIASYNFYILFHLCSFSLPITCYIDINFPSKCSETGDLIPVKPGKGVSVLTCVCRSRGRVGAVGAVSTVRRVKTKVIRLCIIWQSARGAAVVLVGAELAERRSCAVARLLAVVVAAVRRRGHRQSRGLLRLVQAVVTA